MKMFILFMYYVCPNCKHSRRWPWPSDPKKELGSKCGDVCNAKSKQKND